jgi:S-adenosylmethionine-dependent methyltransferase
MKHILVIACYSIMLVYMWLSVSLEQKINKKEEANKREKDAIVTLDRLHPSLLEAPAPMGMQLLAGYQHEAATDFEGNEVGQIWKENGIKIRYEIGISQGHAVDLDMKNSYQWSREQTVHGRIVKLAIDRENVLLITIPLNNKSSWHAANFYGDIKNPQDMVDMILMVLTFKP